MRRVATILVLYIAYSHVADAKTLTLPAPTGDYSVGRRLLRWTDTARPEVFSSRPDEKRQVTVWLWYPAASAAGLTAAAYVEQIEKLENSLPKDAFRLARSATSHATANAPIAATPSRFPVILFSPGLGTIPALYSSLCEDLASRGYVVAAVDHPYDDLAVLLSDGRVVQQAKQPSGGEELLRYERERVTVRAEDLRFVLDQLTRVQDGLFADPLHGRLDLSHVGAFGHSVGGLTAAELCKKEARVLACANMDGVVRALPLYAEDASDGLERPFLFLEKPLPAMKGEKPDEAQRRLASLRERGNALMAGVRSGTSYRVTITGATHATFSDEEFLESEGGKRERELLAVVRSCLAAFFDKNLRGQTGTSLDNALSNNAIKVQAFTPR